MVDPSSGAVLVLASERAALGVTMETMGPESTGESGGPGWTDAVSSRQDRRQRARVGCEYSAARKH